MGYILYLWRPQYLVARAIHYNNDRSTNIARTLIISNNTKTKQMGVLIWCDDLL